MKSHFDFLERNFYINNRDCQIEPLMKKEITDWIQKGGFPFEMQVANAFLDAGFKVAQAIYYQDSDSNKTRETDIIAYTYARVNDIWVVLTFVIECKSSKDKPWVIFSNPRVFNSLDEQLPIYCTKNGISLLKSLKSKGNFKSSLIFKNKRHFGYSIATAFNNATEKSYEAIQSVTKACEYFVSQSEIKRLSSCNIYFPCVFIEGEMFSATMKKDNDLEIKPIDEAELLIGRSFHEHGNSRVFVFNNQDLLRKAKKLKALSKEFFLKNKEQIEENIGK